MEIASFLRSRPRAVLLALLFPVLAGLGAAFILASAPRQYTATATVSVPGSAAESASKVGIFVANFSQLAVSGPVLTDISQETGVPRTVIRDGLDVSRAGQSSIFTVAWSGEDRAQVEPVVRTTITRTFQSLLPVTSFQTRADDADRAYQAAVAARQQYQDQIGTIDPQADYNRNASRISSLQANGGSQAEINSLEAQQAPLVEEVRRLNQLDDAVEAASRVRSDALSKLASARSDANASQNPDTIRDLKIETARRASALVPGVAVAVVAGLLVGLAVLAVPESLRRRRSVASAPRPDRASASREPLDAAGPAR